MILNLSERQNAEDVTREGARSGHRQHAALALVADLVAQRFIPATTPTFATYLDTETGEAWTQAVVGWSADEHEPLMADVEGLVAADDYRRGTVRRRIWTRGDVDLEGVVMDHTTALARLRRETTEEARP